MSAVRTGSPGAFPERKKKKKPKTFLEINETLVSALVFAFLRFYDGLRSCRLTFKLPLLLQGLHLDLEKVEELRGV